MAVDGAGDDLARARTHLERREFVDAETAARRQIKLDPYSARAHILLASALLGQSMSREARIAAERAVAIDPSLADAQVALAAAWLAENQPDAAKAAARRATTLDPTSADAHMVMANAYLAAGESVDANREFDAAIAFEPVDLAAERNWKRSRAPLLIAITIAGLLAFEAVRLLADRFTDWRAAITLLVITLVLVVAVLIALALQRRQLRRLSPTEKMELALEARRQRSRGLAHYYGHALLIAVAIAGLSVVTILFAVGQKASLQVAVGDCFSFDRMVSIEQISTIPCQLPHDVEVFAVLTDPSPPGAAYPGIAALHAQLRTQCEQLYEGYVGVPFSENAPTAINTFAAEESYWRLDVRTGFCALRDWRERQLVGSHRAPA